MESQPSTSSTTPAAPAATVATTSSQPDSTTSTTSSQAAMMVQLTTDGIPKLHCPVCNKALVSLNGYVKHLQKHETPGGFFCRYCDARFCSEEELKKHRDSKHITLTCRICKDQQLTFLNEHEYREHIRSVHDGIDREIFKCDKCGAEYKTPEPFKRHQENQCGTIKPFKCDECEMAFYTKYNLKQHKTTHSGERRFCCSYCGKNFLQKGRLVEHERSHTGEKPYKCDVCGKCFAHRESIVTHSSIHTGIKLVECRCCFSRFSCYSNLIKHRRSRPETCGLPAYNPPKNRVRTRRPRIPPTMNPTSEIKVSNMNKIIKPSDKIHEKKVRLIKKEIREQAAAEGDSKPKAKRKTRGKRKRPVKTEEETRSENEDGDTESGLTEIPLRVPPKRITRNAALKVGEAANESGSKKVTPGSETPATTAVTSTSPPFDIPEVILKSEHTHLCTEEDSSHSAEDLPNFEAESASENHKELLLAPPKSDIKQEQPEDGGPAPPIDYVSMNTSINTDLNLNVKSEYEQNIFNEKDKLLDCLLNDEQQGSEDPFSTPSMLGSAQKLPTFDVVKVESLLDESEVVYIKDEEQMEDMLNCNNLPDELTADCQIILEDVTHRYPELKEETTIKIAPNAKPVKCPSVNRRREIENTLQPRRKYRKRGEAKPEEDPSRAPKRMAKLSQSEVKERLKLIKKEKSWQCPHCIKFYHIRKPFEKHLREEHNLQEAEMKQIFTEETQIGLLDDEVFRCNVCSKIYLVEKRLLAHIKLHGPNGSLIFKCPCYCSIYFATKEEAQDHARQSHKDLLYCEVCDKYMTGHDSLKNHRSIHHSDEKSTVQRNMQRNLVCDKCGKKYSSRTSLTDHVRSDCGRMPLYPCEICGKRLTTAGILKTHLLLHKEDTPFQCDKCGKTFKVKAQYKSHLKTRHTDFKPFKCHLCPKEYPYRESLLTHMTVHTGIKRFVCNGCGKRFTCISNLQAHRKVHADTCGSLPLNAKATQYMGVQKGNLLLGAKPEAGLDYKETNTLIAREVIDRDLPMAQELSYPSVEPVASLATQPVNCTQPTPTAPPLPPPPPRSSPPLPLPSSTQIILPPLIMPRFMDDSHSAY